MNTTEQAKSIVADLWRIYSQLRPIDQRFIFSWHSYLERAGERASVGRLQLQYLTECYCRHTGQIPPARPALAVTAD